MTATVASYHLPAHVQEFISQESQEKHISKGKFLSFLIEDYKKTKQEVKMFKSYMEMATNKVFLQDQIQESEEDFLAEIAHNPKFYD